MLPIYNAVGRIIGWRVSPAVQQSELFQAALVARTTFSEPVTVTNGDQLIFTFTLEAR